MRRSLAFPLLAACAAALLLARAPRAAAETPDAPAVLRSIVNAYTAKPAYSMTFVQSYAPAGFPDASPETGTLTIQTPASLRFDYDGPEGKVYTFDGRAARQYVAVDKQIVLKTLTAAEKARLPLLFLQPPAEILERFAAVAKQAGNGLVDLALTPRADADLKSVTALATPAGELKRLVVLDGEGNRTTFTFTNLAPRKKRPVSDFALVPPKGTRVVGE
ncbi:MAG: outer membrane lipoprotein carrier protein LolA [Holophagales bacterium]|nr:outer membrane lipoprotein carrier protein LolA [Holophagales bacterium]MBK9966247.1 outer membrane lipoprotein carrier protein LolA [Holophagales bacterium]